MRGREGRAGVARGNFKTRPRLEITSGYALVHSLANKLCRRPPHNIPPSPLQVDL